MLNAEIRRSKRQAKKAFESSCKSITIRLMFSDLHNEDVIALTNSQVDGLVRHMKKIKP